MLFFRANVNLYECSYKVLLLCLQHYISSILNDVSSCSVFVRYKWLIRVIFGIKGLDLHCAMSLFTVVVTAQRLTKIVQRVS